MFDDLLRQRLVMWSKLSGYIFKEVSLYLWRTFCPVAGQHLNLPISSHYQHVTGTAAAVFTCLLFL